MNYKAELRGFALDRAIRVAELEKNKKLTELTNEIAINPKPAVYLDDIISDADKIVDYLYIAEKDIKSHLDSLMPLIVNSGDMNRIDALILDLQQIRAEMAANIIPTKPVEAQ